MYLQITDPATTNAKWECFTSYRLCIENQVDSEKSVSRDSWHRFSPKKKSHGWCDFTPSATILDGKSGFCVSDSIVVSADILLLQEEYSFQRDPEPGNGTGGAGMHSDVLAGKFTWKVHNISMFMEVMSMQKIMSPVFPAGGCQLRLSVYQSTVNDVEYLSMCLESKDADKSPASDKSCWCLFRMSVISHKEKGGSHMLRDSYGRFASDARTGDNTSLGWNDYMPISDFFDTAQAYVSPEGTAVFTTSFHIIKESSSFVRLPLERLLGGGGGKRGKGGGGSDGFQVHPTPTTTPTTDPLRPLTPLSVTGPFCFSLILCICQGPFLTPFCARTRSRNTRSQPPATTCTRSLQHATSAATGARSLSVSYV